MPATLDEKITTFFMSNTTDFQQGIERVNKGLDANIRKEREALKAHREAEKAQTGRANSVKNAILDSGGAAVAGIDKFVKSMKLSAVTTGIVGAGLEFASGKLAEWRQEAEAARQETIRFNEEFRKISQANTFATHAQGSGSLIESLERNRDEGQQIKQRQKDLHPHGPLAQMGQKMQYWFSYGLDGPAMRRGDRSTAHQQERLNARQQVKLSKELGTALREQTDLVKEQLQGSSHQVKIKEMELARTREIKALESTAANNKGNKDAINERYNLQVAAEKELAGFHEDAVRRTAQASGIQASLLTDEGKRLKIAEQARDGMQNELRTGQFKNAEERQALTQQLLDKNNEIRLARADFKVAEAQYQLAQKLTGLRGTNASSAAKEYQSTANTVAELKKELAALEGVNTSRTRGLQTALAANENTLREARQNAGFGKAPGQVQAQLLKDRLDRQARDRFDKTTARTDGLINVKKDMAGNIISGTDMVTGQQRAPAKGMGGAERGLHSGANSENGKTGLFAGTLDSYGGTGSIVPSLTGGADLFEARHQQLVGKGLSRPSAAEALANPAAAGFKDPVAEMNKAPIFPDLKATMAREFSGGGLPRLIRPGSATAPDAAHGAVFKGIFDANTKSNALLDTISRKLDALGNLALA